MNTTHQSSGHEHRCRIVVDTCSDIAPQVAGALEVDILGFPYILDGVEYTDDIWTSISPKEFYDNTPPRPPCLSAAI